MRRMILKWLGLTEIKEQNGAIYSSIRRMDKHITDLETNIRVAQSALGRIIGKLEPAFATPDDDPEKRRQSDELGAQVIKRLMTEDWARRHTEGKV